MGHLSTPELDRFSPAAGMTMALAVSLRKEPAMQQLASENATLSSPLSLSLDRRQRNLRIINRARLPREPRPGTGTIARLTAAPARRAAARTRREVPTGD
jgi:hypothetical protein